MMAWRVQVLEEMHERGLVEESRGEEGVGRLASPSGAGTTRRSLKSFIVLRRRVLGFLCVI